MAEKVVCKNPEFLCDKVVLADLNIENVGQAVAGLEKNCSSNTRPMIFALTPSESQEEQNEKIRILKDKLEEELAKLGESGEEAIAKAVGITSEDGNSTKFEEGAALSSPLCNQPFRVEKFICREIQGVGRGAIGQEENNGCSSHTRPMLIEPEGNDSAQRQANFDRLRMELEQALAAGGPAERP